MAVIIGVDGCKAGWLCINKDIDTGFISSEVFSNAQLLLQQEQKPLIVAVDVPIGLSENERRLCDMQAKKLLGSRHITVFYAPIRPAIRANDHKKANDIQKKMSKHGLSIQSFCICRKIREFDEILSRQPTLQQRIKEVHPEICFWACNNNRPMLHKKKSKKGRAERHSIISEYFGEKTINDVRSKYLVKEVAHDDIYDAFIALWTADRIYRGEAKQIPNPSPCDEKGIHMEMWY